MNEIDKLSLKIKQLEDEKKAINNSLNYNVRKERTRRLIQTGALCEKYFGIEELTIEERENFFRYFSSYVIKNNPIDKS